MIHIGAEPGIYQHYKGGIYLCLGVAENPDFPGEDVVIYKPLYVTPDGQFGRLTWRALKNGKDGWLDTTKFAPRFRRIADSI